MNLVYWQQTLSLSEHQKSLGNFKLIPYMQKNRPTVLIIFLNSGNALQVCRSARTAGDWSIKLTNSASTCLLVSLESVMWLSATSLLVTDSSVDDKVFLLRLSKLNNLSSKLCRQTNIKQRPRVCNSNQGIY